MSSFTTNKGRTLILKGPANSGVDLLNDTIKVMLLGIGYTPSKLHNFISDIVAYELSGTGYVAGFGGSGRKALSSKTITQDDTNSLAVFDAADLTWAGFNAGTAVYAGVVKEITNDPASPVLGIVTLSPSITGDSSDFVVSWGANGVFAFES